jgi:hypothetical protein
MDAILKTYQHPVFFLFCVNEITKSFLALYGKQKTENGKPKINTKYSR